MTLIELVTALVVFSIISTAIATLLSGAANTSRYGRDQSAALWEIELAAHRFAANARAAIAPNHAPPLTGMNPTVTTDSNGQSHLTFIVPNNASTASYTLQYYCTGSAAPYTLVEDDSRYDVGGVPNALVHNVTKFIASVSAAPAAPATGPMTIQADLQVAPPNGWKIERNVVVNCRNF